MKASDLFVKALEAEGVKYVFGIPGEETLDLLDSLKNSPIELVLTRHEQAAGFMAATVGRLTGKAGVCLSTLGPGATNLVTPAAYAQLGGMPMVMITGQKPIKSSSTGCHHGQATEQQLCAPAHCRGKSHLPCGANDRVCQASAAPGGRRLQPQTYL